MSSPHFAAAPRGLWFAPAAVAVIAATGADAIDLLNRLGTQDIRGIAPGETRFGLFVTHQGKLVANVRIVGRPEGVWLVTDALCGHALRDWLVKYTITEDASFALLDESWPAWRLVASTPPAVPATAASAQMAALQAALQPYEPVAVALPRGWGEGVDYLLAEPHRAQATAELERLGVHAATLPERERARIEVGEPAIGHELAPLGAPLEWRLGADSISWNKGCFVGQEVLGRLDNFNKVARLGMGVRAEAGASQLASAEQLASARVVAQGAVIGRLISIVPVGEDGFVGLALIKREAATAMQAHVRFAPEQQAPLRLEDRPFWSPSAA